MNSIFQKTGIINQYKEGWHFDTQPIRVLHEMNLFLVQNTNQIFINKLTKAYDKYGFSKTFNIVYGENPITHTTYIKNDIITIYLHETFFQIITQIKNKII